MEAKKNTDKWFPVVLVDDTDFKTAETGKAYSDVTVKYSYEAATSLTTYTLTTDDWKETGEGKYWIRIGASEFTSEGKYEVSATASGCLTFNFAVEVRDKTLAELIDDVGTLLTRLSDSRAGFLDKLNVTGTIAHSDAASTYMANVSALATSAALTTTDGKVDAIKAKTDNLPASPAAVGSAMALADSAITAAKFDQSTAYPLIQADSGSSAVARTGADGDTLETLSDQVDGVQTDLNNPDQYKADVSTLATSAAVAALNDLSAADVNAQMRDVLATDTVAEPAQGAPPASPTIEQMINYLYRMFRNKVETTSAELAVYDDAGTTKLIAATLSDDGTTFTRGALGSGA